MIQMKNAMNYLILNAKKSCKLRVGFFYYIKCMHELMANYLSQKKIYLPRIGRANLKHKNHKTSESGQGNLRINSS
jgi:hypothetical protein